MHRHVAALALVAHLDFQSEHVAELSLECFEIEIRGRSVSAASRSRNRGPAASRAALALLSGGQKGPCE